jgi:sugar lactone lactonase YvrE
LGLAVVIALAGCAGSPRTGPSAGVAQEYAFWPPLPNEPRIQFLRSYRFSSDVEQRRSTLDRIVFGADAQILPIAKPYGVEMWNGRIYVCDITNPGVVILDLDNRQTRLMVTRGVEQMAQPTDITIASDGMKYVIDRRLGRIFVFSPEDRHIATFGDEGLIPAGVAAYGNELYVADFATQSILVFDRYEGTRLRSIGGPGGGRGEFIRPLGVHVDADGDLYVADAIRGRLQKFDPAGDLVLSVGELADTPGNFVRPKHVTVDGDGIVYVVDAAFQNVQMFNADGELLMFFGGPGGFPGAMSLPAGVTVHDDGLEHFKDLVHPAFQPTRLVLVTNQFGLSKVSVYALGGLREGYTIDDIAPYAAELTPPATPESEEAGDVLGGEVLAPGPGEETTVEDGGG